MEGEGEREMEREDNYAQRLSFSSSRAALCGKVLCSDIGLRTIDLFLLFAGITSNEEFHRNSAHLITQYCHKVNSRNGAIVV